MVQRDVNYATPLNLAYFGDPWASNVCYRLGAGQVLTPVGQECLFCSEEILEGDQGNWIAFMLSATGGSWKPVHRECQLRTVLGGPAHLEQKCSCYKGSDSHYSGMTLREEALWVWNWVKLNGQSLGH